LDKIQVEYIDCIKSTQNNIRTHHEFEKDSQLDMSKPEDGAGEGPTLGSDVVNVGDVDGSKLGNDVGNAVSTLPSKPSSGSFPGSNDAESSEGSFLFGLFLDNDFFPDFFLLEEEALFAVFFLLVRSGSSTTEESL
jgi:hypothetical protein